MRKLVAAAFLVSSALTLSACSAGFSSFSDFIADTLPHWAGGLPPSAPPRPGQPGYEEYQQRARGTAALNAGKPIAAPDNPEDFRLY